ncbi:MAG: winged helix DNA-binding domain-containing protein [Acidimicrobiia bacterium]|nr:winged helix DNA-binding domain-containing protein [Acidimicrobiia bacterium]
MRHINTAERRDRLGVRHFASLASADPIAVAGSMVGLHSSDPATVYLSLQARLPEFNRPDLETAMYEDRELLRLLGMRRTMFVVPHDLGAVMDAGCTRALAAAERRRTVKMVTEHGLTTDGEAWIDDVSSRTMAAIRERGEALATELRDEVPELALKIQFGDGRKWAGAVGISTRILFLLATEGHIMRGRPRGTWLSSQYRWSAVADWIGAELPTLDRAASQAELLRRWLRQFGPGTMTDLKWWTGWTVRDTKAALAAVEAVEVELDEATGFVLPDDLEPTTASRPWAAFLPGLDSTPMGWKERTWFLGSHQDALFDRNGNIGPTVWANGRIVGAWGQRDGGIVLYRLLETVTRAEQKLIDAKRDRLEDWLGGTVVMPRFPAPLQKELAAR